MDRHTENRLIGALGAVVVAGLIVMMAGVAMALTSGHSDDFSRRTAESSPTATANAKQAMPTLQQWPQVVNALGNAIAAALLGRADPKEALDQAAQKADAILIVPA